MLSGGCSEDAREAPPSARPSPSTGLRWEARRVWESLQPLLFGLCPLPPPFRTILLFGGVKDVLSEETNLDMPLCLFATCTKTFV